MSMDYVKIGFRIAQRRRELNLKQRELAEAIGISSKYLSNIETGKRHANLELIAVLCDALNATPDYFLLGNIKKDVESDIVDNLKLCSQEDKRVIKELVQICASKHN